MATTKRRAAWWIVWTILMALADALLAAWWVRSGWGMTVCAATMAALCVFSAWSLRPPHRRPRRERAPVRLQQEREPFRRASHRRHA